MARAKLILAAIAVVATAAVAVGVVVAWRPALDPVSPPPPGSFARALVARGEGLALLGNCAACHTAENGQAYAGGRPIETPFGTVFSANITPDPQTGIGQWSRAAFARAMREGVSRDGAHLYPAMPYDHFARASDAELDALFAWLTTRPAVAAEEPANRLRFPFGFRPLIAAWKLLYLREDAPAGDPTKPAEWNRGRVLAEGLAHCGGCHTPRDALGAERRAEAWDGGWVEGWYAPPLNARSPAVQPWTADRLLAYLRTGLSPAHAAAAGPMGDVTRALADAPEAEVRAIATYFASLMEAAPAARGEPAVDRRESADASYPESATLFAGACAVCHLPGAPMMQVGRPPLSWGTKLHVESAHDAVRIVMHGLDPPAGPGSPSMPGFADSLSDRQLAGLAAYLRARFTDKAQWRDVEQAVAAAREGGAP